MKLIAIITGLLLVMTSATASATTVTPAAFAPKLGLAKYQVTYLDKQAQPISVGDYLGPYDTHFSMWQEQTTRAVTVAAEPSKHNTHPLANSAATSLATGEPVPAIQGKNLMGRDVKEDWSSKQFILLSTFSVDCPGCVREIPDVKAFSERHANVKVLYVTWDSVENSRQFASQYELEAQVIANAEPWLTQVGISTYPTLMLLSPTGRLLYADADYDAEGHGLQKMAELLIPAV
ncbi:peroxiredoxin family protein [Shewanella sp. C32]|uniref:Peroxiredoxin family protein n=1 Tax=Shewanella electrica TaxID=515560 RepID=A0ABT2FIR8_9GAMM|nr:redoxin domain-containing protein [Shewanella electrica]MCH1924328.1 peroxiredoxin family protein [Shewanella electrica]MCS4556229.1 peroxiredoxin family protein [Shewanella electrica]